MFEKHKNVRTLGVFILIGGWYVKHELFPKSQQLD